MKPFKKSTTETLTGILGLLLIGSALAFLMTGIPAFFLLLAALAYIVIPIFSTVQDFIENRVAFNFKNAILLPFYYFFSSWQEILFIVMIMPAIAVTMIMGPFAGMATIVGAIGLGTALAQFLFNDRFGLSDLQQTDYLIWFSAMFVIGSVLIYITYIKEYDLGEKMSDGLDNAYNKGLNYLRKQLFIKEQVDITIDQ